MELPRRIFLDTSVINFIVDYYDYIFNNKEFSENLNERIQNDIYAIAMIFHYSNHNAIEMIISNTTFKEVEDTVNIEKKNKLKEYCSVLWRDFHYLIGEDFKAPNIEVKYYEEFLLNRGLGYIKGNSDKRLIIEALFYKCDIFCTRDYKTILKYRLQLKKNIPLELLTPFEWYSRYHHKIIY